jgi:cis-3-alkyl-4-acyloxetan-2-one decarboxylase
MKEPVLSEIDWKTEFPNKRRTVHVGDDAFAITDEGCGDPILMVHGNPTWSFMWRRMFAEFKGQHRMISIDHLGCGFSDKPTRESYTLSSHGDRLAFLVRELDLQNITLMAHDWGGAIGLYVAAMKEPERFRRIILLNTGAFPPPRIPWRIAACRTPILGELAIRGFNLFLEAAFWMAMENPRRMTPQERAGFRAPYRTWHDRIGISRFVKDIPMSSRHSTYRVLAELETNLSKMRDLPVALIWGMRDWCFTPACLNRFRQHWPGASVFPITHAGHWVLEDSPSEVISAVRAFLRDNPIEGHAPPRALQAEPIGPQR